VEKTQQKSVNRRKRYELAMDEINYGLDRKTVDLIGQAGRGLSAVTQVTNKKALDSFLRQRDKFLDNEQTINVPLPLGCAVLAFFFYKGFLFHFSIAWSGQWRKMRRKKIEFYQNLIEKKGYEHVGFCVEFGI